MAKVRETKRADELLVGDWTAPGGMTPLPAEVLHTLTYPHPTGARTHLLLREFGIPIPFDETRGAAELVTIATAEELAGVRAGADRARRIADIRALADFLEHNPDVPLALYPSEQVDLHDGASGVAQVRELGARFGGTVRDDLEDRTQVYLKFGSFEYRVIAWHKDGRPAETEDERCGTCGESLREIALGALGHTLGEICNPVDVPDETPAEHRLVGGSVGSFGENSAECACGTVFDGFDSATEANQQLDFHIEAATSPTGLTKAADQSRGPLAFTTPVVTYFSFGHGQNDPATGMSLLDHYVTVVAPTYEECREAMLGSRFGRAWSFDYLAGAARATEWIPRWIEHEVIVAPGTGEVAAQKALFAAADVLAASSKPADETGGLIVGDTADEQRDNAYAAYDRDEAECPSAWHANQGDERSRCPICNQAD